MSRRWLEAEGIWSCRVRLPENSMDGSGSSHTAAHSNGTNAMAQPSSPAMHIDDSGDALAAAVRNINHLKNDMVLDLPSEPDAQATVTDFLDFTEYLPSDLMRSLTLVQKLEKISTEASEEVETLTKTYGELPSLPAESRPSATNLRLQISQKLAESHKARSLAYAEACRLSENVERHKNREKNIVARLNHMVETYPATREPTPEASNATQTTRPKITLRLDGSRTDRSKVHRRRAPRITVPGEVLAPYDFDYDSFDSGSDTEGVVGATQTPARLKLKVAKKEKIPKPPRGPRPPGAMGTNVHSSVAGISTSNALAKLKPPPADAQPGSEDAPWLKLTAWELATLRKEMKKNAVWSPSDTMIARELAKKNRGIEAYRKWRASNGGEAEGTANNSAQDGTSNTVLAEGEISADAFGKADVQLSNRGMKLNEAKKLKRENQAKELAKIAAEEAEASARKLEAAALSIKDLFSKPKPAEVPVVKTPVKTPARKRKREQTAETDKTEKTEKAEKTENAEKTEKMEKTDKADKADKTDKTAKAERAEKVEVEKANELAKTPVPNPPKKAKTETPINPPSTQSSFATAAASQTLGSAAASTRGDIPLSGTSSPAPAPVPVIQERKASTPILPPVKEKKTIKKEAPAKKEPTPVPPIKKPTPTPTPTQTPAPELQPPRASSRGKASSLEPPAAARDRPRRASTVHNTPAPDGTPAAQPTRTTSRRKKPVPGAVTNTNDGTAPVTVGKRTAATRKSRPKKQKGEIVEWDEFDDEGNIIDPDEPRYCICNRVSYGTMIGCENPECEKEWFHLECVGLTSSPARTTKWYCPECRVKLGIGEKGEVNARGQKK